MIGDAYRLTNISDSFGHRPCLAKKTEVTA